VHQEVRFSRESAGPSSRLVGPHGMDIPLAPGIVLAGVVKREELIELFLADCVTLPELRERLQWFDVPLRTDSSVQSLLHALGIKPIVKTSPRGGGRGVVGYFDPLVAWVIASYWWGHDKDPKQAAADLARRRRVQRARVAKVADEGTR